MNQSTQIYRGKYISNSILSSEHDCILEIFMEFQGEYESFHKFYNRATGTVECAKFDHIVGEETFKSQIIRGLETREPRKSS